MIDNAVLQAVRDLGLAVVIILITIWGLWKVVIPAIIKNQEEQREYLHSQLKDAIAREHKQQELLFEAFNRNTESNVKLQTTLDSVNVQLRDLTEEVQTLKGDVTKVYLILGSDKRLIQERQQ